LLIVSASRRTDLIAFFPKYLAEAIKKRKIEVKGPFGYKYRVDLTPDNVHTFVLWSKNFSNFIENRFGLKKLLSEYSQLYLHFTITGFGGTEIEPAIPPAERAIEQLDKLVDIVGAERISIRFDPILFYRKGKKIASNIDFFPLLLEKIKEKGISRVVFSFVQYYSTVVRRFKRNGVEFIDPSVEEKLKIGERMALLSKRYSIKLFSCSQDFLTKVDGIEKSRCIDAEYFSQIHPLGWKIKHVKDRGQRRECGCSKSKDIGDYGMGCPKPCIYCYANKKVNINYGVI